MLSFREEEAVHRAWLYKILEEIADNTFLATSLYFKGGTCVAMRGFLDRFSVDLDFDFMGRKKEIKKAQRELEGIFKKLGLEVKDKSRVVPQYFLKYPGVSRGMRNTIKIDSFYPPLAGNQYEAVRFVDIDRVLYCQTKETMFANKLIAFIDRYKKRKNIAGRDLYDIYYFFKLGFNYDRKVIELYAQKSVQNFLKETIRFIEKKVNQRSIDQDINFLLPYSQFKKIRKTIKKDVLSFLKKDYGLYSQNS